MLDVIICEDNKKQKEKLESFTREILKEYQLEAEIALSTGNPYDVIDYVKSSRKNVGIYFLDISLNSDIDGFKLAKFIRKRDLEGYIIFITAYSDLAFLTFEYKVEAMDYIVKDDFIKVKSRLRECLDQACKNYNNYKLKKDKSITIKYGSRAININLDDILFFETAERTHKVKVHTFNRQIEYYGTLKEVEEMVDKNFYRSHKSYLVNLKNIKEIDKSNKVAIMINGEECFISSRYMKGLLVKW